MRPAHYLLSGLLTLLLVFSLVAAYHLKADRWGVFAADFESFHLPIDINKLYLKTRFLLSTEHSYDCFVFGSSRVAALDVKRLGPDCYNFTHSGGLVVDHLGVLESFLDAGMSVRKVYVALDDLSYNENPEVSRLQHMRRAYPDGAFDHIQFLSMFLLRPMDLNDLSLVTGANPKVRTPRFITQPALDTERIRSRYQKYYDTPRETDMRFRRLPPTGRDTQYYGDSSIAALRKLARLSRENGFQLQTFFFPLHYKTYLARDYSLLLRFKRDAANIQPFRDFSGLNVYTTDNRYWRETSHFSAVVGDRVAEVVHSGEPLQYGMGRRVTPENLSQLEIRQHQVDQYFLPLLIRREGLMYLPQRFIHQWREQELLAPLRLSKGRARDPVRTLDLAEGGVVEISRHDSRSSRHTSAVLSVRKGEYFYLKYRFISDRPGQYRLQVSQDDSQYEGAFRELRLAVETGENEGVLAGYASVDRPAVKLSLGGGDVDISWSPLEAGRIRLGRAARERAEQFDSAYPPMRSNQG